MTTRPLTREERSLWWDAYISAFRIALGDAGAATERSMTGRARVASEAAWVSLDAFRKAAKGERD